MINLYDEFFSLVEPFEEHNISYAVIGGFAMAFHDIPRFTEDIDILISTESLEKADDILEKLDFLRSTYPHHFTYTTLTLYRYVKTFDDDYLILDLLSGKENRFKKMLNNSVSYKWKRGKVAVVDRDCLLYTSP